MIQKIKKNIRRLINFAFQFTDLAIVYGRSGNRKKYLNIFLIPTGDVVNGGVLSICNIATESKFLGKENEFLTFLAIPNEYKYFLKFTKFRSGFINHKITNIAKKFKKVDKCIIHIPEYYLMTFFEEDIAQIDTWLNEIPSLQINILNQNIKYMPSVEYVTSLQMKGYDLSMTNAHQKYSTLEYKKMFGIDKFHYLSVLLDSTNYKWCDYDDKEDIIVLSPDPYVRKENLINNLIINFPLFKIVEIQGLSFSEYKDLISRAKFSITFGEGQDGYLLEPIFCGGVSFAVYNHEFFNKKFKDMPTVYDSYDEFESNIVKDIANLIDNKTDYENVNLELLKVVTSIYSKEIFRKNLRDFYKSNYKLSNEC